MKRCKYILFSIALITALLIGDKLSAQSVIITGKVKSTSDDFGLPGASVAEMDKNNRVINGVITNADGDYALKITNPENKIAFSFIGYKTKIENINNRKVINASLTSEHVEIEDVEVVAKRNISDGFLSISEKDITTSVQRISAKDIEDVQSGSIMDAMQGRLAGVDIMATSGDPGSGMSIRIRGTTSINSSSEPLIVVDGIPYDTDIEDDFDFSTADEERYAQMLNIPPDNIKEITVLKDAAATAVWGSQAANGVLMITTKRGTKGKPIVRYTYKYTFSRQPDAIPMLTGDQYSMMILEGYMNNEGVPLSEDYSELWYDPTYDDYWNYCQNTDWVAAVTLNGHKHDHNLSLSGGGEKAVYRISVGYQDESGTTLGKGYSQLSTIMNLDYYVSDKITITTDLNFTHSDQDKNYPDIKKAYPSVRKTAYKKMPNMSIYERDSVGNPTDVYFSPESNIQGSWDDTYNPVAMANEGLYNILKNRVIPKFRLKYEILNNLTYSFDVAFDVTNEKIKAFLPQVATGSDWTDNDVNKTYDRDKDVFSIQTYNKVYYRPNLGEKHSLYMMASFTTKEKITKAYLSKTSNTASSELQDPSITSRIINGDDVGLDSGTSRNRSVGALFTFSYALLDRYVLSGSIRRDGSSKFGSEKRYGNFPSISARWRVSGESFMQRFAFLDELSIRASYGENGNAPGESYSQYNTYGTYSWNYLGEAAMYSKTMELANKKWETTIQKNIGFNLAVLNNRLTVDVDYYLKCTEDLFFEELDIPSITGYDEIDMNGGTMDNRGLEILVTARILDLKSPDLSIDLSFNIARNQNVIREISDLYAQEDGEATSNGEYMSRIQIDNPIGSFYGYRYKGVYSTTEETIAKDVDGNDIYDINGDPLYMTFNYPYTDYTFQAGDAKYEDINHDGTINELDVVYLGDANPLFTGGFSPIIRYKDFTFSMFFHYRYGNDVVNETRMTSENMYDYDNQSTAVLRRWRHEGDETDIPRAVIDGGYNWLGSDRFVEDGTFIRLKYVTLTYKVPKKFVQKFRLRDAKIGCSIENPYVWSNYLGQDPEVSLSSDDIYEIGFDDSITPRSKKVMFNLSFSF